MTASPIPMPVLFVGHGSPINALEDNAFTRGWREVAARLPKPRAILCISAHWETRGVYVTGTDRPETIHDFYGFPKALFDLRYPAPGDPELAQRVAQLPTQVHVRLDHGRGLDHGAWSVLRVMYPQAEIPVLQLSLDTEQAPDFHVRLARALAPLRDEGVLILGSGNTVHNLREFSFHDPRPLDWAVRADAKLRTLIEGVDIDSLTNGDALGADVLRGIRGPEHYLPLIYTLALRQDGEPVRLFNTEVIGSIAMTSVQVG